VVPPGDVEIHSELNDVPQPGYRGIKTTLIDRETSVTPARVERDRTLTRRCADQVFAEEFGYGLTSTGAQSDPSAV
jgi:hypothetical protein